MPTRTPTPTPTRPTRRSIHPYVRYVRFPREDHREEVGENVRVGVGVVDFQLYSTHVDESVRVPSLISPDLTSSQLHECGSDWTQQPHYLDRFTSHATQFAGATTHLGSDEMRSDEVR